MGETPAARDAEHAQERDQLREDAGRLLGKQTDLVIALRKERDALAKRLDDAEYELVYYRRTFPGHCVSRPVAAAPPAEVAKSERFDRGNWGPCFESDGSCRAHRDCAAYSENGQPPCGGVCRCATRKCEPPAPVAAPDNGPLGPVRERLEQLAGRLDAVDRWRHDFIDDVYARLAKLDRRATSLEAKG